MFDTFHDNSLFLSDLFTNNTQYMMQNSVSDVFIHSLSLLSPDSPSASWSYIDCRCSLLLQMHCGKSWVTYFCLSGHSGSTLQDTVKEKQADMT